MPRGPQHRLSTEASDDTVRIMDSLRRVVQALSTSARDTSSRSGVSGAQQFVLQQISAAPGLTIGELAERTLSRQSTVSEVVTRLVNRGFVSRGTSPADARQTTLTLTASGRRAIARREPTVQERLVEGLAKLPKDVRATLADGLDTWLAAAEFEVAPATMFFERDHGTKSSSAPKKGRRGHSP